MRSSISQAIAETQIALNHGAPASWTNWQTEQDVKRATNSLLILCLWRTLKILQTIH